MDNCLILLKYVVCSIFVSFVLLFFTSYHNFQVKFVVFVLKTYFIYLVHFVCASVQSVCFPKEIKKKK